MGVLFGGTRRLTMLGESAFWLRTQAARDLNGDFFHPTMELSQERAVPFRPPAPSLTSHPGEDIPRGNSKDGRPRPIPKSHIMHKKPQPLRHARLHSGCGIADSHALRRYGPL